MTSEEITIKYPLEWEDEYRATLFVDLWRTTYSDMFSDHTGSCNPGTLDLFPQYALMFLLRRDQGTHSITWYKIAGMNNLTKTTNLIQKRWDIMRYWMGQHLFDSLQTALRAEGLRNFTGEPDLFCWNPDSRLWFFAEAKGKDGLTKSEMLWFEICRKALKDLADIRVYRLVSDSQNRNAT